MTRFIDISFAIAHKQVSEFNTSVLYFSLSFKIAKQKLQKNNENYFRHNVQFRLPIFKAKFYRRHHHFGENILSMKVRANETVLNETDTKKSSRNVMHLLSSISLALNYLFYATVHNIDFSHKQTV